MNKYDYLYSPFVDLLKTFEDKFKQKTGISIYLFSGYRSHEEQQLLYDKGRKNIPGENKVTNAKPGDSWHQYTIAADYAFDFDLSKPGIQWTWESKFPWTEIGIITDELGLEWGGDFLSIIDKPHIQKTWGLTIIQAKELYKSGGITNVWKYLDSFTTKVIIDVPKIITEIKPEPKSEPEDNNIVNNNTENSTSNKKTLFEKIIKLIKLLLRK